MDVAGQVDEITVTVIVPAYNEAAHLYENLETLWQHLDTSPFAWDIVVVDDGSTDETSVEAERFADSHGRVTVVAHPVNIGIGGAIRTGFAHAVGTYVVTMDSDLSYSPEHVDRLVEAIVSTGAQIVVASPYAPDGTVEGVPRVRAFFSRAANRLLGRLTVTQVTTVTGVVRAYERSFVSGISLKAVDNQINTETIYKAGILRKRVIEIPAHLVWTRDEEETQKRRQTFSLTKTTLKFLFSGFIFRPFTFFILPGIILSALALYSLAWAAYHVITYLPGQEGSVDAIISNATAEAFSHSPHTFLIGGIALIFAFQLISVGILSAQSKRYFEELWFQGQWLAERQAESKWVSGEHTSTHSEVL